MATLEEVFTPELIKQYQNYQQPTSMVQVKPVAPRVAYNAAGVDYDYQGKRITPESTGFGFSELVKAASPAVDRLATRGVVNVAQPNSNSGMYKPSEKYGGRSVIKKEDYDQYLTLGYSPLELDKQFITKEDQKLVDQLTKNNGNADMFWNSPRFKAPVEEVNTSVDPSTLGLIMQMVLGPYIQQQNESFNARRQGMNETQNQFISQMSPEYQPAMRAMQNQQVMTQDQAYLDSLRGIQQAGLIDQFMQVQLQKAAAAEAQAKNQGSGLSFEALLAGKQE